MNLGGAPGAVRKVGYLGPVSPDGQGAQEHSDSSQSKNSGKAMFHIENAGLLLKSAVLALRTYASRVVGVVCRVVMGNLPYYWVPCPRRAHAAQKSPPKIGLHFPAPQLVII